MTELTPGQLRHRDRYGTEPTDKQAAILAFVIEHLLEHQRTPSYREIMGRFGFVSPNAVVHHLEGLQTKGYVLMPDAQTARGVKVLKWPDGRPFKLGA